MAHMLASRSANTICSKGIKGHVRRRILLEPIALCPNKNPCSSYFRLLEIRGQRSDFDYPIGGVTWIQIYVRLAVLGKIYDHAVVPPLGESTPCIDAETARCIC